MRNGTAQRHAEDAAWSEHCANIKEPSDWMMKGLRILDLPVFHPPIKRSSRRLPNVHIPDAAPGTCVRHERNDVALFVLALTWLRSLEPSFGSVAVDLCRLPNGIGSLQKALRCKESRDCVAVSNVRETIWRRSFRSRAQPATVFGALVSKTKCRADFWRQLMCTNEICVVNLEDCRVPAASDHGSV